MVGAAVGAGAMTENQRLASNELCEELARLEQRVRSIEKTLAALGEVCHVFRGFSDEADILAGMLEAELRFYDE